ncbi:hypothetical protein BSKO_13164 [Bryopsis sp. KO-2023]|nr:hypothetical protein BSKO_13164 [Bryopsis sp. KO-2023]
MIMGYVCKYCQCKYETVTPVPSKLTRHTNPQVGNAEEEDQALEHAGRELSGAKGPGCIADAVTVASQSARLFAGRRKSRVTVITATRENLPSLKCAAKSAPKPPASDVDTATIFKHVGSNASELP